SMRATRTVRALALTVGASIAFLRCDGGHGDTPPATTPPATTPPVTTPPTATAPITAPPVTARPATAPPPPAVPSAPLAVPRPAPVLELRYFPLAADGVTLDPDETTYRFTLRQIRARVDELSAQLVDALEQGSVYVSDPTYTPSLHYSILDSVERLTAVPKSATYPRHPDYFAILGGNAICDAVDGRGVREVWIWMYHTDRTVIDESTMAMGTRSRGFWNHGDYGNVSNSGQQPDLPVCRSSYTVY